MTTIRFRGLDSAEAKARRDAGPEVYGGAMERLPAGEGYPCRHCLADIPEGAETLLFLHRPFAGLGSYSEEGPIFLCAEDCPAFDPAGGLPPILEAREVILRGYDARDRIVYGKAAQARGPEIVAAAARLLEDPALAYLHIRSLLSGCFLCRIERAA